MLGCALIGCGPVSSRFDAVQRPTDAPRREISTAEVLNQGRIADPRRVWRPAETEPDRVGTLDLGPSGVLEVQTSAGSGSAADSGAPALEEALLDEKIGEINGTPIFARSFLEPKAARLRAEAKGTPLAQWERGARKQISDSLGEEIQTILLREHGLTLVPRERRVGLLSVLERSRAEEISTSRGSEALLRRQLEAEGQSLEELAQDHLSTVLIQIALRTAFERAQVSSSDIERSYRRDERERYNPEPTAEFYIIQVPARSQASIDAVRSALASGQAFSQVARMPANLFAQAQGGRLVAPLAESLDQTQVHYNADVDAAAKALQPGEVAGPIEAIGSMWWIKFEAMHRRSIPLYEAQLYIEETLRTEFRNEEIGRLIRQLKESASFTSEPEMVDRLVRIAREWYYEPSNSSGL